MTPREKAEVCAEAAAEAAMSAFMETLMKHLKATGVDMFELLHSEHRSDMSIGLGENHDEVYIPFSFTIKFDGMYSRAEMEKRVGKENLDRARAHEFRTEKAN